MTERGSVSLVVAATLGMAGIAAAFLADLTLASAGRGRAQIVADAAALAAAQELVLPIRDPREVAEEYAREAGARVVACRCARGSDEVIVEVELEVRLPFVAGTRTVQGAARATVAAPDGLGGLAPWFVGRLRCLLSRIEGITIVSGFRTRAEQARLYLEKPDLAAPPGASMHERGLAADLGFPSAAAAEEAHLGARGCGLRFPVDHEPWHVEPALG